MSQQSDPERTDEENHREWEKIVACGETRFRDRLRTEGLDPDHIARKKKWATLTARFTSSGRRNGPNATSPVDSEPCNP